MGSAFHCAMLILALLLALASLVSSVTATVAPNDLDDLSVVEAMAVRVVRQIALSYDEVCYVYVNGLTNLSIVLHQMDELDGLLSGVTATDEGNSFDSKTLVDITKNSRCAIVITPLPVTVDAFLDHDRSLWYMTSPRKVLLYIQEDDDRERIYTLAPHTPALNTSYAHILIRKDSNDSDNITTGELLCLSVQPPVIVSNYGGCRDTSENLKGITMNVSYFGAPPNIVYSHPVSGSDVTILELLSQSLGFGYNLIEETALYSNGRNESGLVEAVSSGSSDLGIGGAIQNQDGGHVLAFLSPIAWQQFKFVTPPPQPRDVLYTIFLPFDGRTWILIGVASVALVLVLFPFEYVEYIRAPVDSLARKEIQKFDAFRNICAVYCTLLSYQLPHTWFSIDMGFSICVYLGLIFATTSIISTAYKSMLRSNLLAQVYASPLDSAKDILSSGLPVYIAKGTIQERILADTNSDLLRDIYNESVLAQNGLYSLCNGSNPVNVDSDIDEGNGVFIGTEEQVKQLNGTFHMGSEVLFSSYSSFLVPKCSVLQQRFNIYILKMASVGLLAQLQQRFSTGRDRGQIWSRDNANLNDDELLLISIEQLLPAYLLLGGGVALAAIILVGECIAVRLGWWPKRAADKTKEAEADVDWAYVEQIHITPIEQP